MELRLSIIIFVSGVFIISSIINLVRKEKLDLKYALSWLFIIISIFALTIIPGSIYAISALIGVATPINAIFFLGIVFILIILFTLTVALSRASANVSKLSQEVALLKDKVNNNHK